MYTYFLFNRFLLDLQKENKYEYIKKVTAMASKVGLKVSIFGSFITIIKLLGCATCYTAYMWHEKCTGYQHDFTKL